MTTPVFARRNLDGTVNVVDGEFEADSKFALRVVDARALALLAAIQDNTANNPPGSPGYAYTFNWTGDLLTSVVRTHGGISQQLTLTYDATGKLQSMTNWIHI